MRNVQNRCEKPENLEKRPEECTPKQILVTAAGRLDEIETAFLTKSARNRE